ncbi:MAG: hypothetical protein KC643_32035, partial [Nitrospira sp.]|nr:hypothetical protein [Nitrospira sp.]
RGGEGGARRGIKQGRDYQSKRSGYTTTDDKKSDKATHNKNLTYDVVLGDEHRLSSLLIAWKPIYQIQAPSGSLQIYNVVSLAHLLNNSYPSSNLYTKPLGLAPRPQHLSLNTTSLIISPPTSRPPLRQG